MIPLPPDRPRQWRDHKRWIIALAGLAAFLTLAPPLVRSYGEHLEIRRTILTTERDALAKQLDQLREDAQAALTLSQSISPEEVERLLAPMSRARLAEQLEAMAGTARLTHMQYTLAPFQPWDGGQAFAGIRGVVQSRLTIEADAPHDGHVFSFLEKLAGVEGKMTLISLSITPLATKPPQETATEGETQIPALNLHMKAELLWLANAEAQ